MIVWLLEGAILYGLVATVPLLGLGCLVWYVLTHGIAIASRPAAHKGMANRRARLKAEQAENDRKYQQKEVDKLNQQWQDSSHERLSIPALLGLAVVLIVICWSLKNV